MVPFNVTVTNWKKCASFQTCTLLSPDPQSKTAGHALASDSVATKRDLISISHRLAIFVKLYSRVCFNLRGVSVEGGVRCNGAGGGGGEGELVGSTGGLEGGGEMRLEAVKAPLSVYAVVGSC